MYTPPVPLLPARPSLSLQTPPLLTSSRPPRASISSQPRTVSHQVMDAGEQYALSELRQLISEPFAGQRSIPPLQPQNLYELFQLRAEPVERIEEIVLSPPPNPNAESPPPLQPAPPPARKQEGVDLFSGLREEGDGGFGGASAAGVHSQGRWPRQETLTLLEIRSRLDFKFKEAAEKAPLWEEVSRIMAEEHGYHRSGKKCREKLENLYKYYKKTKEGKAGRHDGKHYRFFRQLEALYGDGSHNPIADSTNLADYPVFHVFNAADSCLPPSSQDQFKRQLENASLSTSSGFESWSSEDDDNPAIMGCSGRRSGESEDAEGSRRRRRKSWRAKMRRFVDQQLEKFMAVQEAWLEKMLTTLETKEKERISREEERRKREAANLEEEHRFWAKERAWIEARDSALIEALERLSGLEQKPPSPDDVISMDAVEESDCENRRWPDREVTRLIQLRTDMEERFQGGFLKSALWEEISAKMGSSGYSRSAKRCKEKWENINKYLRKTNKCGKKRKESSRTCPYYKHLDSLYCGQGSDQSCQENCHGGEAAMAAAWEAAVDQGNEERYVPFLVDGAATTFWAANFLDGGR